jgi:hypothetical protein
VLDWFRNDVTRTMTLLGVDRVAGLDRSLLDIG